MCGRPGQEHGVASSLSLLICKMGHGSHMGHKGPTSSIGLGPGWSVAALPPATHLPEMQPAAALGAPSPPAVLPTAQCPVTPEAPIARTPHPSTTILAPGLLPLELLLGEHSSCPHLSKMSRRHLSPVSPEDTAGSVALPTPCGLLERQSCADL